MTAADSADAAAVVKQLGAHAPMGRRVQSVYLALYTVQHGRIAACWAEWDNLAGLRQLGHGA